MLMHVLAGQIVFTVGGPAVMIFVNSLSYVSPGDEPLVSQRANVAVLCEARVDLKYCVGSDLAFQRLFCARVM